MSVSTVLIGGPIGGAVFGYLIGRWIGKPSGGLFCGLVLGFGFSVYEAVRYALDQVKNEESEKRKDSSSGRKSPGP